MAVFSYKDNAMPQDAIRELSVTRLVIFETDKEVPPIRPCPACQLQKQLILVLSIAAPSDMQVRTPTVILLSSLT